MHYLSRREVLAASISLLGASSCHRWAFAAPEYPSRMAYVREKQYQIVHTAEVTRSSLDSLEVWLPIPMDHPEQKISGLQISPPVAILRDPGGQAAVAKAYFSRSVPPGQLFRMAASYVITRREMSINKESVDKGQFKQYRINRQYRYFTRPERKIESSLPPIVMLAKRLRSQVKSPWQMAADAYLWVVNHTKYQLVNGIKGAAFCLENGCGECGDWSALFVAICRAAGVPARPVTGFWADRTDEWHCWAEFMLPTGQWVPADPTIGAQNKSKPQQYFGWLDNRRVSLCKTYDVLLPPSGGGQQSVDFLQVGAFWFSGGTASAKFTAVGREHPTVPAR